MTNRPLGGVKNLDFCVGSNVYRIVCAIPLPRQHPESKLWHRQFLRQSEYGTRIYFMVQRRWLREAPFDRARASVKRGAGKRSICRWCGKICPKRRRSWCSDECASEFNIRSSPGKLRSAVYKRDRGVCAACGLNTNTLLRRRWVKERVKRPNSRNAATKKRYHTLLRSARKMWREEMISLGFPTNKSPWQADHVLPVSRGGGACGLDNVQTLCYPCHAKKTARENAEWTAERGSQD